jgi:hypothetical protein
LRVDGNPKAGTTKKEQEMSRVGQKSRNRSNAKAIAAGGVPLIVPHGGAEAGRDYESAFDLLRHEGKVHELWHREPMKARLADAS